MILVRKKNKAFRKKKHPLGESFYVKRIPDVKGLWLLRQVFNLIVQLYLEPSLRLLRNFEFYIEVDLRC